MPDFHFHVIASGCYHSVLFIEPDGGNKVLMCVLNFLFLFSKVQVPYSNRLVIRGRIQIFAIGMDGQTADPVVVACKCG